MRTLLVAGLLALLSGAVFAQEKTVQRFSGVNAQTTPSFQVQDKWEVRWDSSYVMAITLLSSDGRIVSGASGMLKGSLYVPKGGGFHLLISPLTGGQAAPWHLSIVEVGTGTAANQIGASGHYLPPPLAPAPAGTVPVIPVAQAPAPKPPPSTSIPGTLTDDQARAVVVIKGDVAEGTGFLVRTANGPAVITNLHVISANPNARILTTTGAQIKVLGLKGAADRDLAMFLIQDDHYTYLDLATDVKNTVEIGDEVITPGNSEGGEVVLNTKGRVLGIGPERIEFDNPIYHGNSGGPVFHLKSARVLAVVTEAMRVNVGNDIDKASFANKNSAIAGPMRYFGLRPDTVPVWETYDWNRFLNETSFLKKFHEQSLCLDSFMNGAYYEKTHVASADGETGRPDSQYYLRNEKIETARDNFHQMTVDTDNSQRLDAVRELVMSLQGIADTDLPAIQNPANFYSFDRLRAAQEVKYRKALRDEVDKFAGKVSDLGH